MVQPYNETGRGGNEMLNNAYFETLEFDALAQGVATLREQLKDEEGFCTDHKMDLFYAELVIKIQELQSAHRISLY